MAAGDVGYKLSQLQTMMKHRVRINRATTGPGSHEESGNLFGNTQITNAINAGRKHVVTNLENAEIWARSEAKLQTAENTQEYILDGGVIRVDKIWYDVDSDGKDQAATIDCINVHDAAGEAACMKSPSDQPSATNVKYRITNKGFRLIASTAGAVVASKYLRIEYVSDLIDLSGADDYSKCSKTVDELVMDYAMYHLYQPINSQVATEALQTYYTKIDRIQMRNKQSELKRRI